MVCFKCNVELYENKSEYGFYYRCPKCGKTFETKRQSKNNQFYFKKRIDYKGNNNKTNK